VELIVRMLEVVVVWYLNSIDYNGAS